MQTLSAQQATVTSGGIVANANNPVYQTTASQLVSARKELAGLRAQAAKNRAEIDMYEQLLRKTPGVEREYSDIMRRRSSLQTTYQQIQDKLQNAQIAQNFETEQGGERFTRLRAAYPAPPAGLSQPHRADSARRGPGLRVVGRSSSHRGEQRFDDSGRQRLPAVRGCPGSGQHSRHSEYS